MVANFSTTETSSMAGRGNRAYGSAPDASGGGGGFSWLTALDIGDDAVHATLPNERVKEIPVFVLRWPQTARGILAQDPRDVAWSGARLIVDSGATRHAVGNIWLLEDFEPSMPPLVATLADGSNLHILGVGHIRRGDFNIPNVSLVDRVQDCLISTQQLDSDHGLISCFGNGICRIMQADGTEVGGAILEQGGYILRYLDVPGPAQDRNH